MSTKPYYLNGKRYDIGTRQKEPAGKNESGQENDISAFDLIIPTYGAWAGPSWSDNQRVTKDSTINWSDDPCKNELIKVAGANPDTCNSLIDAMAKQHDWNYEVAEHSKNGDEASLKMTADEKLLNDVKTYLSGGTYTCTTGKGTLTPADITDANYTLQTISYASTALDTTEKEYAGDLSIAFTFKLVSDALCVAKEDVVNTFMSIFNYVTGGTNKMTSADGTLSTQRTTGGDYLCIYEGEKACVLDTDACKIYNMGKIVLADGSAATENNFVYEGDGKITINGGTGNDKITTGKNDDPTYYTLAGGKGDDVLIGGAGADTYVFNFGDGNDTIIDDARLLKNAHMLCCAAALVVAEYAKSTPHFSGFARLAFERF